MNVTFFQWPDIDSSLFSWHSYSYAFPRAFKATVNLMKVMWHCHVKLMCWYNRFGIYLGWMSWLKIVINFDVDGNILITSVHGCCYVYYTMFIFAVQPGVNFNIEEFAYIGTSRGFLKSVDIGEVPFIEYKRAAVNYLEMINLFKTPKNFLNKK